MGTQLTRYDGILIDGAAGGRSANELSVLVNGTMSPAECVVRVRRVLADKDIWTDPERRKLMLHRVYEIVDELSDLASKTQDAKDYSALIRGMELLRKVLAEQGAISGEEMERMVRAQAGAMLGFISTAFDHAKATLQEAYPDLPMDAIENAFEEGLVLAQSEDTNV